MRVLSFDPGYERLGIAVLEKTTGRETLLYSGCFQTEKSLPFPERLAAIGAEIRSLLEQYRPELVALELLYLTNNQKTAMAVAEVRGVILFLAAEAGATLVEYTPQQVKVAVTGDGRGDKRQVMAMVPKLVAIDKVIRHDDEFDAIAVGLTALACHR